MVAARRNRLRNKDFRVEEGIITPSSYDEFRETLELKGELSREGLIDFAYGAKSSVVAGKIPLEKLDTRAIPEGSQVFEPGTYLDEIVLNTRSMMEVLFFASAFVRAPEEEVSSKAARDIGLVDPGLFNVLSSRDKPSNAWLKVKFRGYWFYIDASDLTSRASFGLLDALFESVVGNVPGGKPLLTLPVRTQ